MPIEFKIRQRLVGFSVSAASGGGTVNFQFRELVPPTDYSHLYDRLDKIHGALLSSIPGLPPPSQIDHILVLIRQDLSAVAYVNELRITAMIKPNRPIKKGEAIRGSDIDVITSIDLGVEIAQDVAIVLIRSYGWHRSLFYDFGPILDDPKLRDYPLERAFAEQALLLIGLLPGKPEGAPGTGDTTLAHRKAGVARLQELLRSRCEEEAEYQVLLQQHPWMLGGVYDEVTRHAKMDDKRIPDFTARRCFDFAHDIIEVKQPFLTLFRKRGGFAAGFNDSWNQAVKYLAFAHNNRAYLFEEKQLRFENPRTLLLLGYQLDSKQLKAIREKESLATSISVRTYDELLRTADHLVHLMETAHERIASGATTADG